MEEEMCPALPSSLSSTTEVSAAEMEDFSLHFASMYHSIFPPLLSSSSLPTSLSFTPSPSSSSAEDDHNHHCTSPASSTTDDLLFQARLILEHRQLRYRHDLCVRRLHQVAEDVDYLRQENAQLRLANAELVKVISSKTAVDDLVATPNSHLRSLIGGGQSGEEIGYDIISPTSVIGKYNDQFEGRNNLRRISLPKSISVRSATAAAAPLNIQSRRASTPMSDGGSRKREEDATSELEVYNQGMSKTELCNKWQETSSCPYGNHCRFAHGLEELRPVMRHPRYKTQMCRMVLAGEKCPYGHRCHFRHCLSQQ